MKNFLARVEDIQDPLELGRVRFRLFGIGSDNNVDGTDEFTYLPTADLLWATPIMPPFSPSSNGIGDFYVPDIGSTIVVFSMDDDEQIWFYMGTVYQNRGKTTLQKENPFYNRAFKKYKDRTHVNLLATGVISNTEIELEIKDRTLGIKGLEIDGTSSDELYDEWENPYLATYPYNRIISTHKHMIELDDTPKAERIHIHHWAGNFFTIYPDGREMHKSVNDTMDITKGNEFMYVTGDSKYFIDGDVRRRSNSTSEVIHKFLNTLIGGYRNTNILDDNTEFFGANSHETIVADNTTVVSGNRVEVIGNPKLTSQETKLFGTSAGKYINSYNDTKTKTSGKHVMIVEGSDHEFIHLDKYVRVKKNYTVLIDEGNLEITVTKGTRKDSVEKDYSITVKSGKMTINVLNNECNIKASGNVTVDGKKIILNKGAMGGVVRQQSICPMTGKPHSMYSPDVVSS